MYLKDSFIRTGKKILIRYPKTFFRFFQYLGEYQRFKSKADKRFPIHFKDIYPSLQDKLKVTPFDHHYIYHPAWAARKLVQINPAEHVDISSILNFGTILSAIIPVKFYDYRPADINISNYQSAFADLLQLPFENNSISSLSCLHTIEHVGLGRYGDKLDPDGDLKAMAELKRVLGTGGDLLFATPVGQPKIEFNAHRIYSFEQIIEAFAPLSLHEFSLITDDKKLIENADPVLVAKQKYGCGCFWFKKN